MIFDFECGIPVGDLLAIIYYVKRTYFKNKEVIYDETFKKFIYDLVVAKGIPEDQHQAGILTQELLCTPQAPDMEDFIEETQFVVI